MFEKSVLKTFLFFGLMVVSLGACSGSGDDARFSGKGEIVDRTRFLKAYTYCEKAVTSDLVVACVTGIFDKEVDEYCAEKKMSPAHEKCAQLHNKVKGEVMMNMMKNLNEAKDAANSRSK
jgi:hypothetical protein